MTFEKLNIEELLTRIPFFFALLWLAKFSSKQYRQNKRLEQEYAHKEVVAKSYQGYKKEFESQDQTEINTNKETLPKLYKVLLDTIAKNPSKIMDDGHLEDTHWIQKLILALIGKTENKTPTDTITKS